VRPLARPRPGSVASLKAESQPFWSDKRQDWFEVRGQRPMLVLAVDGKKRGTPTSELTVVSDDSIRRAAVWLSDVSVVL